MTLESFGLGKTVFPIFSEVDQICAVVIELILFFLFSSEEQSLFICPPGLIKSVLTDVASDSSWRHI